MGETKSGRPLPRGMILISTKKAAAGTGHSAARELLFDEGFSRMGWGDYEAARLRRGARGKPLCTDPRFCLNYTDTKGCSAAAFADADVGIDLEAPRMGTAALIRRLAPEESAYLEDAADREERQVRFIRIWTAKEAFCKMTGSGMIREILETSFLPAAATEGMRIPRGDGIQRPLPAGSCRAVRLCGTDCFLTRLWAGGYLISVCVRHECAFDVAFLDAVD